MRYAIGLISLLTVLSLIGATPQPGKMNVEPSNDSSLGFSARKNAALEDVSRQILSGINTIRTLLSFGTQISDVYSRLTSSDPPNYNHQYQIYLSQITDELEGIRINLNGVSSFLDQQQPLGCSYSRAENQILTSLRHFRAFNQSSSSAFLKQEFLRRGAELEASIEHLLAGLNGDYIINADIITVVRDELDCHQHPFNEKMGKFLGLVNTGLELHEAYVKLANVSVEENSFFLERVNRSYERINYRIRHEIENCASELNFQRDVYQLIRKNNEAAARAKILGRNDMVQLSDSIGKLLSEKYSYRNWLVFAEKRFGDIDATAPRMMSDHFFKAFDRSTGINVAALSMDRRRPRTLSERQREMLTSLFYFEVFQVVDGGKNCVEIDPRQGEGAARLATFTCDPNQIVVALNTHRVRIEKLLGSLFAYIVLRPFQYLYGDMSHSVHLFNPENTSVFIIPL